WRPCTASSCCCQVQSVSWAPRTDSKCCCQARNLSWAPVPPPTCCMPLPECVMGPCTASHMLLSLSPHSANVPLSGLLTLLVVFHFCHRVLYGLPLLLPPPPHCGSTTLVLAHVTAQNE
ncbi:unnamed protein product, partial [Staurois parvus]